MRGIRALWRMGIVLLFVLPVEGCRENSPLQPVPASGTTVIVWHVGDQFTYDTWRLNSSGPSSSDSPFVTIRRVVATNVNIFGQIGVTVMIDSLADTGGRTRTDTIYFYQSSDGDLWQYGLLSSLGQRYGWGVFPLQWERIAGLSEGWGNGWSTGQADSISEVVGSDNETPFYFALPVNGSRLLLTAHGIELYDDFTTFYGFWISPSPAVFIRIVEPASSTSQGLLRALRSAALKSSP